MSEHSPSKERVEFERWLFDTQGLESVWEPHRNCHKDFAAHLAFKAWQAARAAHELPGDAEKLLDELVDAARHQAVKDERFMSYAHECAESDRRAKRTREARAAVLAAMRPHQPPADEQIDHALRRIEECELSMDDSEGLVAMLTELKQRRASSPPRAELERYKQALQRANGFLIMHNLEPVKLEYNTEPPSVRHTLECDMVKHPNCTRCSCGSELVTERDRGYAEGYSDVVRGAPPPADEQIDHAIRRIEECELSMDDSEGLVAMLTELKQRRASSPPPASQLAWLVEGKENGRAVWYTPNFQWTTDANEAMWFVRKLDAELFCWNTEVDASAVEHMFCSQPTPTKSGSDQ